MTLLIMKALKYIYQTKLTFKTKSKDGKLVLNMILMQNDKKEERIAKC